MEDGTGGSQRELLLLLPKTGALHAREQCAAERLVLLLEARRVVLEHSEALLELGDGRSGGGGGGCGLGAFCAHSPGHEVAVCGRAHVEQEARWVEVAAIGAGAAAVEIVAAELDATKGL
jgi:hypothetical protein